MGIIKKVVKCNKLTVWYICLAAPCPIFSLNSFLTLLLGKRLCLGHVCVCVYMGVWVQLLESDHEWHHIFMEQVEVCEGGCVFKQRVKWWGGEIRLGARGVSKGKNHRGVGYCNQDQKYTSFSHLSLEDLCPDQPDKVDAAFTNASLPAGPEYAAASPIAGHWWYSFP